jgi:hypothetical protein
MGDKKDGRQRTRQKQNGGGGGEGEKNVRNTAQMFFSAQPFNRQVKSHLPFAGIVRSSPCSPL